MWEEGIEGARCSSFTNIGCLPSSIGPATDIIALSIGRQLQVQISWRQTPGRVDSHSIVSVVDELPSARQGSKLVVLDDAQPRQETHPNTHTPGFVVPPTNGRSKRKLQAVSHKIWWQMQDLVTRQECRLCEGPPVLLIFIQGPPLEPCVELSTCSSHNPGSHSTMLDGVAPTAGRTNHANASPDRAKTGV